MLIDNNTEAFFLLLKAGLWEHNVKLSEYGSIDLKRVYRLAQEQSVVGLIAAGIEHAKDAHFSKEDIFAIVGDALQLEQRNKAMNYFISVIVDKMRDSDIYALLVKGQGIAQCYERPLLRECGDVDFYLSKENFQKAKAFFKPFVESEEMDSKHAQHINMHYDPWVVEIHANQHCSLSKRVDNELDRIHHNIFYSGNVRSWCNGGTLVFLPSPDNDIIIVFTHFLAHFYKGGLGVRQICDWCRLLWFFRETIDKKLLKERLKRMGLVSVWKGFASFAVEYLGMPRNSMPLYDESKRYSHKAKIIKEFLIKVGNFGHNRDCSYYSDYSYVFRKMISFYRRINDFYHHSFIFPLESFRFLFGITINGFKSVMHGD